MGKPDLDWARALLPGVCLLLTAVSSCDGTVTVMFGGYGYYYKIAWKIGDYRDFISAETPGRLEELALEAVGTGRATNAQPTGHELARGQHRSAFDR